MKKELYVSPEIKVLSFQFEAIVCGSGGFEKPGLEDDGEL